MRTREAWPPAADGYLQSPARCAAIRQSVAARRRRRGLSLPAPASAAPQPIPTPTLPGPAPAQSRQILPGGALREPPRHRQRQCAELLPQQGGFFRSPLRQQPALLAAWPARHGSIVGKSAQAPPRAPQTEARRCERSDQWKEWQQKEWTWDARRLQTGEELAGKIARNWPPFRSKDQKRDKPQETMILRLAMKLNNLRKTFQATLFWRTSWLSERRR
ncbi:MAG: hypothetical protein UZ07_CHB004000654 [Chlorobi bacterium OLB7]|nr:MAG: hypothetical protein UZ07_CHB004000654 [Chlorobi bacterium OLB7]